MADPVKTQSLRTARVLENEERILRAAHRLFVQQGYRATTLTAVAEEAGVASRTVYVRFGTKAAVLKRVIDMAVVGDLAPVDVRGRDWYRTATTAATLAERIAAFTRGGARLARSAADVVAVSREAEPTEPLLAEQAHAGRAATYDAVRTFWTRAQEDGLLPPTCDLAWLVRTTALAAHIDTYLLLREMEPGAEEAYETWLTTTFERALRGADGG
ncbi:TetR/AcrR family transcriptional regulator [Nocardioides sp. SLBN-35]|uniref:TetR/AcrR family transcriptional regulator n=1 Tax=Nocardioides sp. SLBN-35 TaxID=2768445 RepID=UPI0011733C8C|nr:TetR/AcrR family transcriptional regulator [Nocardioides sp. SLBN-35]TQK71906.1 TetR family transcriptional regulator [Nocardioides sp. SLBN-35]